MLCVKEAGNLGPPASCTLSGKSGDEAPVQFPSDSSTSITRHALDCHFMDARSPEYLGLFNPLKTVTEHCGACQSNHRGVAQAHRACLPLFDFDTLFSYRLKIFLLNGRLTSLMEVRFQVPNNLCVWGKDWTRKASWAVAAHSYADCGLWLRGHGCQPRTLTVRIWLLCRAATVEKPGRPYGQGTARKQHDTKRHTDIPLVDKHNKHVPNATPSWL